MTEPDRDQIRAFVAVRVGRLSNRRLVSDAQDRLAEANPPAWFQELAFLGPAEIPDAHHVLEKQLYRSRVLPDSEALRSEIRAAIAEWTDRVTESGVADVDKVVRPLHLCPGYALRDVSVPIEEFPYPACTVRTVRDLVVYLRARLDELVPPS